MGEKLELRLKSPVGAEPAVYPWPLPVYVSAAPHRPYLPASPPPPPLGTPQTPQAALAGPPCGTETLDSTVAAPPPLLPGRGPRGCFPQGGSPARLGWEREPAHPSPTAVPLPPPGCPGRGTEGVARAGRVLTGSPPARPARSRRCQCVRRLIFLFEGTLSCLLFSSF